MKFINAFLLMSLGAMWGSSFLFMKVAVPEFGPVPLIGIRLGLAAVVLLAVYQWQKPSGAKLQLNGSTLFVGIFGSALPFTLFAYATLYLTAGVASVLNATVSIFAAVIAYFWLKENLTVANVVGLLVGFIGVCLLVDGTGALVETNTLLSVGAGLLASISYAVSTCFIKYRLPDVDPLSLTTASTIGAFVVMLPLTAIFWPAQPPSVQGWLYALALAVICTGAAYMIFYHLIAQIGVSKTATVSLIIPMFAVSWGVILLGEEVTLKTALACLAILSGTVLSANLLPLDRKS